MRNLRLMSLDQNDISRIRLTFFGSQTQVLIHRSFYNLAVIS